jgi:hypothetical protein
MRQKSGFDRYPEFKSKGIEFEVGNKYLFWQLTDLFIRQSCQACSSNPLRKNIIVTTQDFIKFWGKIFVFILLVLIENSQGFKTFEFI